jgi:hypothetical protein
MYDVTIPFIPHLKLQKKVRFGGKTFGEQINQTTIPTSIQPSQHTNNHQQLTTGGWMDVAMVVSVMGWLLGWLDGWKLYLLILFMFIV